MARTYPLMVFRLHASIGDAAGWNKWYEANFDLYHCEGADLSGADLGGLNLQGFELFCVDLQGANLSGADLRGANPQEAHFNEDTCFDGALLDEAAKTSIENALRPETTQERAAACIDVFRSDESNNHVLFREWLEDEYDPKVALAFIEQLIEEGMLYLAGDIVDILEEAEVQPFDE